MAPLISLKNGEGGLAIGKTATNDFLDINMRTDITGTLNTTEQITTQKAIIIKDTRFDRDGNNPSSDIWSYVHGFQDKDGENLGYLQAYQLTDGSTGLNLYAETEDTEDTYNNFIQLAVDKSGNKSYAVADPEKFRSAIGLDTIETGTFTANTSTWNPFSSWVKKKNGIVTVCIQGSTKTQQAAWSNFGVTIGTISQGFRPAGWVHPSSICGLSQKARPYLMQINDSGAVQLRTFSEAVPADTWIWVTCTYFAA